VNNTFGLPISKRFRVIQLYAIWLEFPIPVQGYPTLTPLLEGSPLRGTVFRVKRLGTLDYRIMKAAGLYLICARFGTGT
jgi:hypothetical protein